MFNFGISSESAVKNSRRPLAPWSIHTVKFKGVEIREFAGKKDPNAVYKVLDIKFENEDGYFTVTKFFPKDGDDERRTYDGKNGGKVETPSNFEVLKAIISQTVQVLNPEGFLKLQAASSKFKSFDDMAKGFISVTNPVIDTETKIKLIGHNKNGKVTADIPRIVAINKKGEAFIADNYIGNKLYFSDYEETQRVKYEKATPTDVVAKDPISAEMNAVESKDSSDDFDFDNLL